MTDWGGYVARTAVRKIVYVLVGLGLAALLAVSGVDAADFDEPLVTGIHGDGAVIAGPVSPVGEGTALDITVLGLYSGAGSGNLWLVCDGSDSDSFVVDAADDGATWRYLSATFAPAAADSCYVELELFGGATFEVNGGALSWSDEGGGAEPTPTPDATPSPTPEGDPGVVVVELSEDDRTMVSYSVSVVAFLLTVIAVVTGLRR